MSGDLDTLACDAAGLSDEGPRKRLLREVDLFLSHPQVCGLETPS